MSTPCQSCGMSDDCGCYTNYEHERAELGEAMASSPWVNFDMLYPDGKVSSEVRETWNAWFRHHTIDPAMVLIEGTLVVDFDHYRISYPSYDPDAEEWITLQRTLQLEARPSEPPCF